MRNSSQNFEQTLITIALPFYSGVEFLKRAIESVQNQSSSHWRLVVLDDSPTHETQRSDFETYRLDPKIEFRINPISLGMAENWNQGLDLADHWVTLLHADDELDSRYVEQMLTWIGVNPEASLIFTGASIMDEAGHSVFSFVDWVKPIFRRFSRTVTLQGDQGAAQILRGNFIMCPTICYSRRKLRTLRFSPRYKFIADVDFYLRVLLMGGILKGYPTKKMYRYRRHPLSTTSKMNLDFSRFREELEFRRDIGAEFQARSWERSLRAARGRVVIVIHFWVIVLTRLIFKEKNGFKKALDAWRSLFG